MSHYLEKNETNLDIMLENVKPLWKQIWLDIFKTDNGKETLAFLDKKFSKQFTHCVFPVWCK